MGLFDRFKKKKEVVEETPKVEEYIYVEGCDAYVTDQGFLVILSEIRPPFKASITDNEDHKKIHVQNINLGRDIDFGDIKISYMTCEDGVVAMSLLPEEPRRQKMEQNRRMIDRDHPFIPGTYDVSSQLRAMNEEE